MSEEQALAVANTPLAGAKCADCGMPVQPMGFHPFAACLMFRQTHSTKSVEANLKLIVEYGMRAKESNVGLDVAMRDITKVV